MSSTDLASATDAELTSHAREGDHRAVVELWTRHYPAALAAARRSSRQPRDAEELASDAFAGMLAALTAGGGPTGSVRAYLLTSVRNAAASRSRRASAADVLTDDVATLERVADAPSDPVAQVSELGLMREAFATLPRRWQVVLWRTAVDRESNAVVGEELGLSPNAVAALARRARRGLRTAYVQVHVSRGEVAPGCAPFIDGLASLAVAGEVPGMRPPAGAAAHVSTCERCTERLAELRVVEKQLAGVLGPAILSLAPGLSPASVAVPEAATRSGSTTRGSARHGRLPVAVAGAAAAAGVAVAATIALWPTAGPASTPGRAASVRPSPAPSPSASTPTPTASTPRASSAPSVVPTPHESVDVAPTPAPRATGAAVLPRVTPLNVGLGLSGSAADTDVTVSAEAEGLRDGLRLTLSVPQGVVLVGTSGDFTSCMQSGVTITCTAPADTAGAWRGTLRTAWEPTARGPVTATLSGVYVTGAQASGAARSTWPPTRPGRAAATSSSRPSDPMSSATPSDATSSSTPSDAPADRPVTAVPDAQQTPEGSA